MATMTAAAILGSTATTAQVAALASTISTGFTIAGTAFSMVSSIAQGNQQAKMLEAQAANDAANARLNSALLGAESAEKDVQDMKKLKAVLAEQEATGRSSVIIEDSLSEAAKTFDIRRFNTETQQAQLEKGARNTIEVGGIEADNARRAGKIGATKSFLDFASRTSKR